MRRRQVVVFDTGGGSSQFTFGDGEHVEERFSLDVGAVAVTERFGLDRRRRRRSAWRAARAAIAADLARLDGRPAARRAGRDGRRGHEPRRGQHGLATYDPDACGARVLERAEIDRQIELYRTRDAEERRPIVGLQPKRAEVILAGACIVRTVLDKLGRDSLTVSDRGLRHGVLFERFSA